jgi:hypothetical protein
MSRRAMDDGTAVGWCFVALVFLLGLASWVQS